MPHSAALNKTLKGMRGFVRNFYRINVVQAENGHCIAKFTLTEEDLNPMGDLHSGLAASLVDMVSSLSTTSSTVWKEPQPSCSINLMRIKSAKLGDELKIVSRLLKVEGDMAYLGVDIFNSSNELLVKGEHVKFCQFKKKE